MSNPQLGGLPGISAEEVNQDTAPILKTTQGMVELGVTIEKDSEDASNVGKETTLLKGTVLIRIETGGNAGKYAPADHSEVPASNAVVQAAILQHDIKMVLADGSTVVDRNVSALVGGVFDEDELNFVDSNYRDGAVAAMPLGHFIALP